MRSYKVILSALSSVLEVTIVVVKIPLLTFKELPAVMALYDP